MHLEFRLPFMPKARGQGRGNSGLYHQGRYETQVLDSFGLEGKNNETGGLYSIKAPDLNMCLPPMAWQTYDVDLHGSKVLMQKDKKTANAKITVKLNGVVVHRDVELPRTTTAAPVKEECGARSDLSSEPRQPCAFSKYLGASTRCGSGSPVARLCLALNASMQTVVMLLLVGGLLSWRIELCWLSRGRVPEYVSLGCHRSNRRYWTRSEQRVHPEWLVDFIANPHDEKPGTTMPDLMSGMAAEQRKEAALAIANFLVGRRCNPARR